ncbi:hypothetical protein DRO54_03845 [Candidatus Bathyarchaeota archaeon]|nr:MAG: hypothetical protein DRO54_03845 [Candidatus Bathyarchaeota archaeon]
MRLNSLLLKHSQEMITVSWALICNFVLLFLIYTGNTVTLGALLIVFFTSFFAGVLIADFKKVVISSIISLVITILLMFLFLFTFPLILGGLYEPILRNALLQVIINKIFKVIFPFTAMLYLVGGILGGIFSDVFI